MDLLDGGLERLAKLCRKYSRLRRRRSGTLGKRFRSGKLFRRNDRFIPCSRRSATSPQGREWPRLPAGKGRHRLPKNFFSASAAASRELTVPF